MKIPKGNPKSIRYETHFSVDARQILTDDFVPIARHQPHERSAAVALTGVFAARLVSCANHILRDQTARVVGLDAVLVADDRYVHVPQVARSLAVLVQRTPTGRFCHAVLVRVICTGTRPYRYYNIAVNALYRVFINGLPKLSNGH